MELRRQYHFWPGEQGLQAWDVHRLIELAKDFEVRRVPVADIHEIETVYWFDGDYQRPTVRSVIEHARLIRDADLAYPIILSATGRVMDGMHRVARAVLEDRDSIEAVQFETDPPPDYVGVSPRDLPYD